MSDVEDCGQTMSTVDSWGGGADPATCGSNIVSCRTCRFVVSNITLSLPHSMPLPLPASLYLSLSLSTGYEAASTLEATHRQIDGFFGQLPNTCHQNRVAYVGDRLQISPWVTSRVAQGCQKEVSLD